MFKVFIYGTCQTGAILKFLKESNGFDENYTVIDRVLSYEMINGNINFADNPIHKKNIEDADVFIYQPTRDIYKKNSTNYLKSLLKPHSLAISIPFMYNLATWPLLPVLKRDFTDEWTTESDKFVLINREAIDDLVARGVRRADILALYDKNQLDFYYDKRFKEGIEITRQKEEGLDVKVCSFIEENISKKRLFMYCSHPTSPVFVHATNQVLTILNLPLIEDNFPMDFAGITSCNIPLALPTSSVDYFKFEFTTKEEENIANSFYRNIVDNYLKSIRHT